MAEKITLEEALRENKELKAKIAELTEMVNYLQKQLFGKKTEKLSAGQLDLFDDFKKMPLEEAEKPLPVIRENANQRNHVKNGLIA